MASSTNYIRLETHYAGGFIFLSYVVSVVGAWTTLELLLKRTGGSGWYNILLLVGAGVAFGSTATFGMHFVGNQAVTLHLPPPFTGKGVPLSYDVGFTILSLIVSCLSMILAFSFIGLRLDPKANAEEADAEALAEERSEKGATDTEGEGQATDEKVDGDNEHAVSKRASFHGGSRTHAIVNLPLPLRKAKQVAPKEDSAAAKDGGDFGTQPVKVSLAGAAKILGAGFICGGGIAAMHYVGQVSINSVPRVTNTAWIVVISILIAMLAVSLGLFLLFVVLRPKLQHRWYKRLGVAMILGIGVCLMHFVALLGTHYFIIEGQPLTVPPSSAKSKHLIIALVCVVAPVCCLSLLVFAFVGQQRVLRQIAARHRIVLAVAIFDQQGLVLCKQDDGLLPSAQIFPNASSEDSKTDLLRFLGLRNRLSLEASSRKLTRADPAFIAFLRATWTWKAQQRHTTTPARSTVAGTEHVETPESVTSHQPTSAADSSRVSMADIMDESRRVSESGDDDDMSAAAVEQMRRSLLGFEMAAQEIATSLVGAPDLQATGVLFDNILKTGHFEVSSKKSGDSFTVTQGQLLVLTRRLRSTSERDALMARGYVFADPQAVARVTAGAFAVPTDRVFDFFRDIYRFSKFGLSKRYDRGRLYAGVLIVQALAGEGLQVVADEKQHHSLPMVEVATLVHRPSDRQNLPPSSLATATLNSVMQALESLGGHTLQELIGSADPYPNFSSAHIQSLMTNIVHPYLARTLSPETLAYLLPRLVVSPELIPLSEREGPLFGPDGMTQDSYLICLKAVVPAAITIPSSTPVNWLPFSLFKAQADCVARASGPPRAGRRVDRGGSAAGYVEGLDNRPNPGPVDVFPPRDSASARASRKASMSASSQQMQHSPMSNRYQASDNAATADDDEEAIVAVDEDPARPPGLPRYDSNFVFTLVRTSIQPSRPWNWDLPAREQLGGSARLGQAM